MNHQEQSIAENSLYKIDRIDQLAIIRLKADSPLEDLYNVENSDQYFGEGLEKILGKDISTRLYIFSNNTFSEERFNEFFKTIKIEENEKANFLSSDTNIRLNALARFTNIKHRFIKDCLESEKINIIALKESAIGLWLSTLLSGDYSILSENSQFTFPFIEDDILPLGGLVYYLDKYATKAALDDLLLFGKPISATDLDRWGLVNRVLSEKSEFEQETIEIALDISKKSYFYIKKMKNFKRRLNRRLLESLELDSEYYSQVDLRRV